MTSSLSAAMPAAIATTTSISQSTSKSASKAAQSFGSRFSFPGFQFGTSGDDTLNGGNSTDFLFGLDGNDTLNGNGGQDWLFGGAGDDQLNGGSGDDQLFGGSGNDSLNGGSGFDTANYLPESGSVVFRCDIDFVDNGTNIPTATRVELQVQTPSGTDVLENIERIIAPSGQNNRIDFSDFYVQPFRSPLPPTRLSPSIQVDLANGTLSYDQTNLQIQNFQSVTGSYQDDEIRGNGQANELSGFFGADTLDGRGGNDTLIANGNDTLTGGSGADTFRFEASSILSRGRSGPSVFSRANTMTDFQSGQDRIELVQSTNTTIRLTSAPNREIAEFQDFSQLTLGALSSSEFFTINDRSEINRQVTGIYYIPSSGELYYQDTEIFPPASSRPFAIVQGGTITAADFTVV